MTIIRIGAAMLVAGMTLSACGGAATQGGSNSAQAGRAEPKQEGRTAIDPCSYISAEAVAAITTDKVSRTSASGASCTYHSEPDDGMEITIHATDGVKKMDVMRRTIGLLGGIGKAVSDKGAVGADTGGLLQKDKSEAPALGDDAVWGPNTMLAVRKGDFYVEVTPPIMHDPASHPGYPLIPRDEKRKIVQQVAEKVLAAAAEGGR